MGKHCGIGSFLIGGLIGAGVALLFAPRSGEETRAIVADKVDELWGEGEKIYAQGRERISAGVAHAKPVISKKNDELREKIENARASIAEQVAKNAAAARNAISDKIPATGERIHQTADVVRGKLDEAANKLKGAAAGIASRDADAELAANAASSEPPAPAATFGSGATGFATPEDLTSSPE